jgi:hypothetical protein
MIFEADVDQIKRLNSLTLVQLMKRLMLAECRLADIPLRAAAVPLQITVADGGEDGRIEWTGGVDETDYFPARFCVFQSKAQNMTEALVTDGVSRLQTNKYNSTCWPYCHGHTLPPSWLKACNPARNGGAHDHNGFYHGVVL